MPFGKRRSIPRLTSLGKTLTIDNRPYTIAGVLESSFSGLFPGDNTELYVPLHHGYSLEDLQRVKAPLDDNRYWGVQLIGRRKPGFSEIQMQVAMDTAFPVELVGETEKLRQGATHLFERRPARTRISAPGVSESAIGLGWIGRVVVAHCVYEHRKSAAFTSSHAPEGSRYTHFLRLWTAHASCGSF